MVGRTLSHYHVVEKLGEGGMGVVYKARDTRLDRFAALKVLPADKVADLPRKQRFVQEAQAASALNHPSVITIYDIDTDLGVDFIAMEFVAGRSLDQRIPKHGMRTPDVLRYGVQLADALAAAHAAGIIHRDLKPANIMIAESGLVKVLDFGIAKLTETSADPDQATKSRTAPATEAGTILGTIAYMSPEQAQGLTVDSRSDIFSLGAVLYEMLTGHPAFSGDTRVSTLAAILDREPEPLAATIPRDLDRIVTRCLKKNPARRFQTMADLRVALEELKEESDSGRLTNVADPPVRRVVRRWALPTAVLAVLAVGIGWWIWRAPAPVTQKTELRQLTFDAADNSFPKLSPDAKLVAYQSDRAGAGRFDIWAQQTSGGPPIRLTTGSGDNRRPVFSGDGSKVYFESTGPPQGIYEVSAFGGAPRLVAADAMNVAVSPDGRHLAYVGRTSRQLFVVPAAGGEPRQIAREFSLLGANPLWFYDSERLATFAMRTGQPTTREFWSVPISSGEAVRLNWSRWVTEHQYYGVVNTISPGGGLASMWHRAGGNQQIYLVRTAPGDLATGEAVPITNGAAWSANASVAHGKMAFQSGTPETGLWRLAADTNAGRVTGDPVKMLPEKAVVGYASATPDGKTVAFSSNKHGSMDVFVRDLPSGQERVITADSPESAKILALIDANATKVVYSMGLTSVPSWSKYAVYEVPLGGGTRRRICEACGPTLSLSPDGKQLLAQPPVANAVPSHVDLVDVATGTSTVLLQHPQFSVSAARFSPDGGWVAFVVTRGIGAADVLVAPFRDSAVVPEAEWIGVTPAPGDIRQVFWSPDGGLVYYDLNTGASSSLMARRLERGGHPVGAPLRVHEFTGRLRPASWYGNATSSYSNSYDTLSAVPGGFVGVLSELSFNIWLMDLPKDPALRPR